MEQIQNENRKAANSRRILAQSRAMERSAQRPQLEMFDNQPEPTEPIQGGAMNEAGLRRVVGGRRKSKKAKMMEEMMGEGKLEITHHSDSESEAAREGKMLADHLGKLHGGGFLQDFAKGFMSVLRPVAQAASFIPGPIGMAARVASGVMGQGRAGGRRMRGGAGPSPQTGSNQVAHSMMDPALSGLPGSATGGQDVPPGGVAPVAYGNVPQAPASFTRNTVGMGRAGGGRAGGAMPMEKAAKKSSQRGQMISKLMKEHGMTLGEASRHLKENGGMA